VIQYGAASDEMSKIAQNLQNQEDFMLISVYLQNLDHQIFQKMKHIIFIFLAIAFISSQTLAQVSSSMMNSGMQKTDGSAKVYMFLAESIQSNAFKGNWANNKSAWMQKLGSADLKNVAEESGHWSELVSNIKPAAFQKGVKQKDLLKELSAVKDKKALNGIISKIASGLKSDYLSPEFSKNREAYVTKIQGL
jgi:hypothetical protein